METGEKLKANESRHLNYRVLLSIVHTSSLLINAAEQFCSQHGITAAQLDILMALKDQKAGMSQQDLSGFLFVTKSNVVGLIDRAEERGLVIRKPNGSDRRSNLIVCTSKGIDLIRQIEKSYFERVDLLMKGVSTKEATALISVTSKIQDNV